MAKKKTTRFNKDNGDIFETGLFGAGVMSLIVACGGDSASERTTIDPGGGTISIVPLQYASEPVSAYLTKLSPLQDEPLRANNVKFMFSYGNDVRTVPLDSGSLAMIDVRQLNIRPYKLNGLEAHIIYSVDVPGDEAEKISGENAPFRFIMWWAGGITKYTAPSEATAADFVYDNFYDVGTSRFFDYASNGIIYVPELRVPSSSNPITAIAFSADADSYSTDYAKIMLSGAMLEFTGAFALDKDIKPEMLVKSASDAYVLWNFDFTGVWDLKARSVDVTKIAGIEAASAQLFALESDGIKNDVFAQKDGTPDAVFIKDIKQGEDIDVGDAARVVTIAAAGMAATLGRFNFALLDGNQQHDLVVAIASNEYQFSKLLLVFDVTEGSNQSKTVTIEGKDSRMIEAQHTTSEPSYKTFVYDIINQDKYIDIVFNTSDGRIILFGDKLAEKADGYVLDIETLKGKDNMGIHAGNKGYITDSDPAANAGNAIGAFIGFPAPGGDSWVDAFKQAITPSPLEDSFLI